MPVAMLQSMPQPLPEEAVATTTELAANAATSAMAAGAHGGINYIDLMLKASLPVQPPPRRMEPARENPEYVRAWPAIGGPGARGAPCFIHQEQPCATRSSAPPCSSA